MDPATLRYQILLLLEGHERGGSSALLEDSAMAEQLNVPLLDVQRQLDNLEQLEFVRLTTSFGPRHDVQLTARGRMALEEASRTPDPAQRRIGF